MKQMTEENVDS